MDAICPARHVAGSFFEQVAMDTHRADRLSRLFGGGKREGNRAVVTLGAVDGREQGHDCAALRAGKQGTALFEDRLQEILYLRGSCNAETFRSYIQCIPTVVLAMTQTSATLADDKRPYPSLARKEFRRESCASARASRQRRRSTKARPSGRSRARLSG